MITKIRALHVTLGDWAANKHSTSKSQQKHELGKRVCLWQVPRTSSLQQPAALYQEQTRSHARLRWGEPSNECNIGHGVFTCYGKTKERKQMQCQNEKTLQFQLHTCKPSTWIDPARCFPIIIHFHLLTSLNKYNLPNQILTIYPILNLMNFPSFTPFSQYAI